MIKYSERCTGCGACLNVCPVSAIKMEKMDAYIYPVIDNAVCIKCNKCSNVCMIDKETVRNDSLLKFEYRMQSDDILNSSSGGFCFSLSKAFIEKLKGIVYAASFNKVKKIVEHKRIQDIEGLIETRGSKYVKSEHYSVYKLIKEDLDTGRSVLFIGLPCENHGLLSFLGKQYGNLFTISLLCGGAVSNDFFKKYIEELEKHFKQPLSGINFRNKKYGADILCTSVRLANSKEIILKNRYDYYIPLEGSRFVRPSCHYCKLSPDYINSDFVVGDCFGGAARKNGLTVVLTKQYKKVNALLNELDIDLIENEHLQVSSRAINNIKKQTNPPTQKEYSVFINDCECNLNSAIKSHIYSKYTFKQKVYRVLPYMLKAKLKK